jgi:hypothetical protein
MNRRQFGWLMAVAMLTVLAVVSAPAFPAEEAPPPEAAESAASGVQPEAEAAVEKILQEQEKLLTGQRFSYDPAGRRDPFMDLYEAMGRRPKGPRPPGIAGMLVTEIDLVGIVKDPRGGDMALVIGSDNKGYFLGVGDQVYDGTVLAVDTRLGTITFRQQVNDPRLIKPYRDVVKRLVPLDDEESADE